MSLFLQRPKVSSGLVITILLTMYENKFWLKLNQLGKFVLC